MTVNNSGNNNAAGNSAGKSAAGSTLYRKEALERISSPEQLTDYLRVTNPGIWTVLIAVMILLAGFFAWSAAGNLETITKGVAVVENGTAEIVETGTRTSVIDSDMSVRINSETYDISTVNTDEYGRSIAYAPVQLPDGTYDTEIITESIHPIKFLLE